MSLPTPVLVAILFCFIIIIGLITYKILQSQKLRKLQKEEKKIKKQQKKKK